MKMQNTSSRMMAWLGLIMLALSLSPVGMEVAAAQANGLPVVQDQGDVAQEAQPTGTGSFLEVHVVECEPGTTGTAQELRDECHDNGLADITMTVQSVDPALGIDQDKTTLRVNDAGPGIINTGTIPAGEYRVEVNIPDEGNTFVVGCEFFDRDEVHPVSPENDQDFNVVIPQGEDIVCDLYVIPGTETPEGASFDFTVTTCERADMPGDGRTFEELSANCTNQPADDEPIEFTLVNPDGTESKEIAGKVDVDGQQETHAVFDGLPDGNYDVSSDVDLNEGANYLFCTYEGQPRYEKEFDAEGVTTFTNMLGEQVECDWFVVYAGQQDAAPTATTVPPTATTVPPTATTVPPTATSVPATEVPPTATVEPEADLTEEPPVSVAAVQGTATLSMHVNTCEMGYEPAAEDFATFSAECDNRTPDVGFTVQAPDGTQIQANTNADGNVVFTGLLGDYGVYSNVPLEAATEYIFCSVDGAEVYQKEFSTSGVTSFTNFLPDETVECSWYIVPQNLRVDETGGTVTVHLSACPPNYEGQSWYNDCHSNGVPDMPYTLTGPSGEVTKNTVIESSPARAW